MRGQMMFTNKCYPVCGGPYWQGRMRNFISKEERKEMLDEYIQDLKKEVQAAEKALNENSFSEAKDFEEEKDLS